MSEHVGALLTGIVSRSAGTVQAHRSVRDGFADASDFKEAVEEDRKRMLEKQEGFAFYSGGQADWLDLLRPIALSFQGFEMRGSQGEDAAGPVTRWFRTNTFYRKPLVAGKIAADGSELGKSLPAIEKGVLFVLGPYSFTRLVENKHYENDEALGRDYAEALAKNVATLKAKGYACVLLLEPSVGYDQSRDSFKQPHGYVDAVKEIRKQSETLGIHFPLADAKNTVQLAEETDADFIGVDCVYTANPEQVKTSKDLLLGVIDGARAGVEDVGEVCRQVKHITSNAKFSGRYYTAPNNRLYDVPFEIALQKIDLLSRMRRELE